MLLPNKDIDYLYPTGYSCKSIICTFWVAAFEKNKYQRILAVSATHDVLKTLFLWRISWHADPSISVISLSLHYRLFMSECFDNGKHVVFETNSHVK